MDITYSFDIEGVDWTALKADLAADDFDNDGRTPEDYRHAAENSALNCFAYDGDRIVGTVRAISDGVTNAYIVDVWTQSAYRKRGIARRMMELTLERLPGQRVCLFTDDDAIGFYERLGFHREEFGAYKIAGYYMESG